MENDVVARNEWLSVLFFTLIFYELCFLKWLTNKKTFTNLRLAMVKVLPFLKGSYTKLITAALESRLNGYNFHLSVLVIINRV